MQRSPFFIPGTAPGGKSFPMGKEGIIFCLLVLKIKAHSQVSKTIFSRKNPNGRFIYMVFCITLRRLTTNYFVYFFFVQHLFRGDAQAGYKEMYGSQECSIVMLFPAVCSPNVSLCPSMVRIRLSKCK